jgi:hypothetical protein
VAGILDWGWQQSAAGRRFDEACSLVFVNESYLILKPNYDLILVFISAPGWIRIENKIRMSAELKPRKMKNTIYEANELSCSRNTRMQD